MTHKEKAEELVKKFRYHSALQLGYMGHLSNKDTAKECAIIAVDEILEAIKNQRFSDEYIFNINFWENVKTQIEKL